MVDPGPGWDPTSGPQRDPTSPTAPGGLPVDLVAPAKLTLGLRVTGVRADGYHTLDAEMVTVNLADRIRLTAGSGIEVRAALGGTGLAGGTGDTDGMGGRDGAIGAGDAGALDVPADADNLVARTLAVLGWHAHARITKAIPAGAGLGGGSADAAAVLRWAGQLDPAVAAGLGADVAFCVVGGRARVTGVGEVIEALPARDATFTLAFSSLTCSTPAVYAAWDDLGGPTAEGPNDLEPAALAVEPRLAEARDTLGEATGEVPILAGSGSTWFVPGAHPGPDRLVVATTNRLVGPGSPS